MVRIGLHIALLHTTRRIRENSIAGDGLVAHAVATMGNRGIIHLRQAERAGEFRIGYRCFGFISCLRCLAKPFRATTYSAVSGIRVILALTRQSRVEQRREMLVKRLQFGP